MTRPKRGIALLMLWAASSAWGLTINDRMTVVEAIEAVRNEGYRISYSSRLVQSWMRVRSESRHDDPIEALRAVLASYSLDVEQTGDDWVIVAGERKTAAPAPAPVEPPEAQTIDEPPPLDEITIVASRHAVYAASAADQFLSAEDIQQMPHMADDAFRALHRLPGIAASDFQAPFNLRGGANNEVRVQLNGVELVEPFHMRTLFQPLSIIDPGIIGEAEVLSGGFTAKHGRYMSGVVDIRTARRESRPAHEVGVSFVSAFARSGGELADGRGSYFVSGRRGYLDLLADAVVDDDEELEPRYSDLFASIDYGVTDSLDIGLETLLTQNDVRFVDPNDGEDFGENSEQQHVWLTANWLLGDNARSATSLYFGTIDSLEDGSQIEGPVQNVSRYYERNIDIASLKTDWVIPLSTDAVLEAGAEYRDLQANFDYRLDSTRRSDFVDNGVPFQLARDIQFASDGADIAAYLSFRRRMNDRLIWELGARWDKQTYVSGVDDSQISPRFNLRYTLTDRAELRLAWGEFYQAQPIQSLDVPDADLSYYGPERAEHRVLGLRYQFSDRVLLQADAYQKRYMDLRPRYENLLDLYEFAPESNFDRARIEPTDGQAYGAEVTLKSSGNDHFDWWVNYTWSKVYDNFDGPRIPRNWDQRNAVTANLTWRGERWRLSVIGRFHSGWPRTPLLVDPIVDANGNIIGIVSDLSQRNSDQFDDYSRLDLRLSRFVPLRRGSFEYYFEVFNVLDSENQCCTSNHRLSFNQGIAAAPEFDEFLPFFPSFGFVWRFGPGAE